MNWTEWELLTKDQLYEKYVDLLEELKYAEMNAETSYNSGYDDGYEEGYEEGYNDAERAQ